VVENAQPTTNSSSIVVSPTKDKANFDLFLNHKYVSEGAIISLDGSRNIFFQVQNIGAESATNLSVYVALPIDETNIVYDHLSWNKKAIAQWMPYNHQMYNTSGSTVLIFKAIYPLTAGFSYDITAFQLSKSITSFSFSRDNLANYGWKFPNLPDSISTIPYMPILIIITSDNSDLEKFDVNVPF
jgi:hypothetical protein